MNTYDSIPNQMRRFRFNLPQGVRWILGLTTTFFILQLLFDRGTATSSGMLTEYLALWSQDLRKGYVWQLVTYMLLHSNTFIWHIVLNLVTLFFIGPETERTMGTRQFLTMYILSGVLGGLSYVVSVPFGAPCVGASGAIFGVIGAMAALYPNRQITLLLFFVFPVTMRIWVLALGLLIIQSLAIGLNPGSNVAYGVHIAGGITGYLYTLIVFRQDLIQRWIHRWKMKKKMTVLARENPGMSEIDRVLDKVASEGLASLTSRERILLDKASEARRKR